MGHLINTDALDAVLAEHDGRLDALEGAGTVPPPDPEPDPDPDPDPDPTPDPDPEPDPDPRPDPEPIPTEAVPIQPLLPGPLPVGPVPENFLPALSPTPVDEFTGDLTGLKALAAGMAPDSWAEVPNTRFSDVMMTRDELALIPEIKGNTGPRAVITAWNGWAYDSARQLSIIFGGGHKDYGGNDSYRLSFADPIGWARLTQPQRLQLQSVDSCPIPVEGPVSSHTYDGFCFCPLTQTGFYFSRRGGYCKTTPDERRVDGGRLPVPETVWEFHPEINEWFLLGLSGIEGFITTTWDEVTELIFVFGSKKAVAFDPVTHDFSRHGGLRLGEGTSFMDLKRRRIIYLGRGGLKSIDPDQGALNRATTLIKRSDIEAATLNPNIYKAGISHDTVRDKYVIWSGQTTTWTVDPETLEVRRFDHAKGPVGKSSTIYSKWQYIEGADVFVAYNDPLAKLWIHTPGGSGGAIVGATNIVENPDAEPQAFKSPTAAGNALRVGGTLTLGPGIWPDQPVNNRLDGDIFVQGTVGQNGELLTHLAGSLGSKFGTLAFDGTGLATVRHVKCSGASVSDGNGSCVRVLRAKNLDLEDFDFSESQEGVLTGKELTSLRIANGRIVRCGGSKSNPGRAHGVYCPSQIAMVEVDGVQILIPKRQAHLFKLLALQTTMTNVVLADLDGVGSRQIDMPIGGVLDMSHFVLEKGPESTNQDVFGIGLEIGRDTREVPHTDNIIRLHDGIIIIDRGRSMLLNFGQVWAARGLPLPTVEATGVMVVGGTKEDFDLNFTDPSNTWRATRADAGMDDYPYLPSVP